MTPGAAGRARVRTGVVATAAALVLALCVPPVALAASVEASPVVTVEGSVSSVVGTVTLSPESVASIADSVRASTVTTVTLSEDWIETRNLSIVVQFVIVFLLGVTVAYRVGRG